MVQSRILGGEKFSKVVSPRSLLTERKSRYHEFLMMTAGIVTYGYMTIRNKNTPDQIRTGVAGSKVLHD